MDVSSRYIDCKLRPYIEGAQNELIEIERIQNFSVLV